MWNGHIIFSYRNAIPIINVVLKSLFELFVKNLELLYNYWIFTDPPQEELAE